jgi:aspartate/tyrosine/aromatic aminotransferase
MTLRLKNMNQKVLRTRDTSTIFAVDAGRSVVSGIGRSEVTITLQI